METEAGFLGQRLVHWVVEINSGLVISQPEAFPALLAALLEMKTADPSALVPL